MLLITLGSILQKHASSPSFSRVQPMPVKLDMGTFSPMSFQNKCKI